MTFNCLLNSLRLNANITLRYGSRTVLQEPLNKSNVIAIVLVNLCRVPFAEAVGAYALIAQIVADYSKLLLDCPLSYWKHTLITLNSIAKAVVLYILLDEQRDCEDAALACLLLYDLQVVAFTIKHYVARTKLQNVADPQA